MEEKVVGGLAGHDPRAASSAWAWPGAIRLVRTAVGPGLAGGDLVETRPLVECLMAMGFLLVRLVHLGLGAVATATGGGGLQRPALAALLLAASALESTGLASRLWRHRGARPLDALVDVAFGCAALVVAAVAIQPADRTTPINWVHPYTVGGGLLVAIGLRSRRGSGLVLLMAAVYGATVTLGMADAAPGWAPTVLAHVASYPLFYGAGACAVFWLRTSATALDEARRTALDQSRRLQRLRHQRDIHDGTLQVLEALAGAADLDLAGSRRTARAEADRLRRELDDADPAPGAGLESDLRRLAADFTASHAVRVELVLTGLDREPPPPVRHALHDATREALNNVARHSASGRVTLAVIEEADGLQVSVRDYGIGFQVGATAEGFGTRHSIRGRLEEVRGQVEVWSQPGQGTCVTMRVPT